jgi:hypothetical protein
VRAKKLFAAAVEMPHEIRLVRACATCGDTTSELLPSEVRHASLEYVLPNGLRADIALFDGTGCLWGVVEICATHPCEPEKVSALAGLTWAEFDASEILGSAFVWKPRTDHLQPHRCARCLATTRPFMGPGRLQVSCPLTYGEPIVATTGCPECRFFLGAGTVGVRCAAVSPS